METEEQKPTACASTCRLSGVVLILSSLRGDDAGAQAALRVDAARAVEKRKRRGRVQQQSRWIRRVALWRQLTNQSWACCALSLIPHPHPQASRRVGAEKEEGGERDGNESRIITEVQSHSQLMEALGHQRMGLLYPTTMPVSIYNATGHKENLPTPMGKTTPSLSFTFLFGAYSII